LRIPISKPFLPSREEYHRLVDQIWNNEWLTNNGNFLLKFEDRLREFLDWPYLSVVSSGTMALQLALRTLKETGDIITTPFSYVATTSAIVWEGFTPIFADIEEDFLGIDPKEVVKKITPNTKAILATHVYGNPGLIDELEVIAKQHGLTLIFDGAHSFGSNYLGKPLINYGDITTLSFHATKLFHSVSGGAVICKDRAIQSQIDRYRNFGHTDTNEFNEVGINGKMCEFHSAMGLLNLGAASEIISRRKSQWEFYKKEISTTSVKTLELRDPNGFNASYFPIIFCDEDDLNQAINKAHKLGIELRRYFYPSLNLLNYVNPTSCPISERISKRICCLPLYHEMTQSDQLEVLQVINEI